MKKLLFAVAITSALCACKSTELQSTKIDEAAAKQATNASISQEQAVSDARDALAKAATDELRYYTPLHFANAQNKLKNIEALQKDKEVDSKIAIITEALKAKKLIDEAYTVKETILSTLKPSFDEKLVLVELGSDKMFPSDFADINEDLQNLFRLIEQDKVEKARNSQADLLSDMTDLEVETLLKRYIVPAEFILDQAEDIDADTYAENTYDHADETIERSEDFIKNNYRDREKVKEAGAAAVLAAKKALNTGALAKSMFNLDEEGAELKALEMEKLLDTVADALGTTETQGLSIKEKAAKLRNILQEKSMSATDTKSVDNPSEKTTTMDTNTDIEAE